nr:hypothetical protein [Streptomyces sp. alain-838]
MVGDHAARALSELRDPVAVDVLRALAVCGDLLDFPLVCTLVGPHPVPEARLRAALGASGLLTTRGGSPSGHDAVVRARILEEMPAADRADLYARAARLAQRVAVADQGIAELLLRARPVGAPWAVDTLRRGFAAALRSGRRDRATAYLTRALTSRSGPRREAASNSSWPRCRWSPPPWPRSVACTDSSAPPTPAPACAPRPSICASSAATPAPPASPSPPLPAASAPPPQRALPTTPCPGRSGWGTR